MMLRDWRIGRLVASWVVYWLALLAVALAPLAREYWEIQRTDGHGTIDFSWAGGALQAVLLIIGPPLLMPLLWIAARPRRP